MATPDDVITSATAFFSKVKEEDRVTIKFVKKDGTERTMKCTLNFKHVPLSKRPKDVNVAKILTRLNKHGIINVYDLEKQDWRSVPFKQVQWLETGEENQVDRKRFRIQPPR